LTHFAVELTTSPGSSWSGQIVTSGHPEKSTTTEAPDNGLVATSRTTTVNDPAAVSATPPAEPTSRMMVGAEDVIQLGTQALTGRGLRARARKPIPGTSLHRVMIQPLCSGPPSLPGARPPAAGAQLSTRLT